MKFDTRNGLYMNFGSCSLHELIGKTNLFLKRRGPSRTGGCFRIGYGDE